MERPVGGGRVREEPAARREARRGRFSNLEQLLEVRAARWKDNLVRLESSTIAGEGDIDEVLVISEGLELAGDISLKVVPTQAKLLLAIRHSPRSTPFDHLSLPLSFAPRAPHHPPSVRLTLTFTFFCFCLFCLFFLFFFLTGGSVVLSSLHTLTPRAYLSLSLLQETLLEIFRKIFNMEDSLRRRGWGWLSRSGLFYCTLVLLVRDEALITLEKKWQVQKVQSMTEEEVCTWGESIDGLPTLRDK